MSPNPSHSLQSPSLRIPAPRTFRTLPQQPHLSPSVPSQTLWRDLFPSDPLSRTPYLSHFTPFPRPILSIISPFRPPPIIIIIIIII